MVDSLVDSGRRGPGFIPSSAGAPFVVAMSKSHFHSSRGNDQKLIASVNSKKKKQKKNSDMVLPVLFYQSFDYFNL